MDISNETIDKLADLAKLEFSGDEKEKLKDDLNKIITFIDKLNELDTQNVEPLIFMSNEVNMYGAPQSCSCCRYLHWKFFISFPSWC